MRRCLLKDGRKVIIREANEKDAKAIEHVVNSVASEKLYVVPDRSREDWDEAIRVIRARKNLIVVAEIDGNVCGMALLVRWKCEKNRHVVTLGVSILQVFRNLGVCTAIMKYMLDWAKRQRNLEKISLTTFSTNVAALRLHQRFGFETEELSKKQFKIDGNYVDEVTMGKFLD